MPEDPVWPPLAPEPDVLLTDEPAHLLPALVGLTDGPAGQVGAAYRVAGYRLRGAKASERAAYLALAARQGGADPLADRFAEQCMTSDLHAPWWPRWWRGQQVGDHLYLGRHTGFVRAVVTTEVDGRAVAVTGDGHGIVRVWDLLGGGQIGEPASRHGGAVVALAATVLDGRAVAVSSGDDDDWTIRRWDLNDGTQCGEPEHLDGGLVGALTPVTVDGRPVLVVGQVDYDDGTTVVTVWDPTREPFAHAQRLDTTPGPLLAVAAATGPKGSLLVGAVPPDSDEADDRMATLFRWDPGAGRWAPPLSVPTAGHINALAVADMGSSAGRGQRGPREAGDGRGRTRTGHLVAVVADRDDNWTSGRLRLLDLDDPDDGRPGTTLMIEPSGSAQSVAVASVAGHPVAVSGHRDGAIRLWDLEAGAEAGAPRFAHGGELRSVTTATVGGRPVAVTGGDHSVRLWDLSRPDSQRQNGEHAIPVQVMAMAELDGRQVAVSGGRDGIVRVWDMATGIQIGAPLEGHEAGVAALGATSIDGRPVAVSTGFDRTIRLWDLPSGTLMGAPLPGAASRSIAVADVDGHPAVVVPDWDSAVGAGHPLVWDLGADLPQRRPLTAAGGSTISVATAMVDGTPVLVGGSDMGDGAIRLWDLTDGTPLLAPLQGHHGCVEAVVTTEMDGRAVAVTGGFDTTIRCWDLRSGGPATAPMLGHTSAVQRLAAATIDGRPVVASCALDGVVHLWDLSTGHLAGTIDPGTGTDALALAEDGTLMVGGRLGLLAIQLHPGLFG
jgi:WD40 repeat protein